MKVIEVIQRAKDSGCAENVSKDILMDSISRLERQIAKKAEKAFSEINNESVLLACGGGVAEGYDDMYDSYLKRVASRICEAWENYGNYDTVFAIRYQELCKEIIRSRTPKRYEWKIKS